MDIGNVIKLSPKGFNFINHVLNAWLIRYIISQNPERVK